MARKRRVFGGSFKAKVALAAARGDKTSAELASQFKVHANQVAAWKKTLVDRAGQQIECRANVVKGVRHARIVTQVQTVCQTKSQPMMRYWNAPPSSSHSSRVSMRRGAFI